MRTHVLPTIPAAARAAALALLAAAPSCSVFTAYPSHTADHLRNFERGHFGKAACGYAEEASGGDELLYRLEEATVLQTAGDFAASRDAFARAEAVLQGYEERPDVSGREIAEGLATAFLNDKSLPYDGERFERVLLNALQSLNYLMLGDLDGAMVEARRSSLRQRAAEEDAEPSSTAPPENVFAQYLGGALRELNGDVDNAYVDYKAIHARAPGLVLVQRDLLRIAEATGRPEDLERWIEAFGALAPSASIATAPLATRAAQGEILVLYASGMAPVKDSIEIPVPTGHGVTKVSVPRYVDRANPAVAVRVVIDGAVAGRTEMLEDVGAVARESLSRRLAGIIARSVARAAARGVATEVGSHQLRKGKQHELGFLVSVVGSIFSLLVEQADLRSWLTLPRNFQVARVVTTSGPRDVRLELLGAGDTLLASRSLGRIEIPAGSFAPVYSRSIGDRLHAYALQRTRTSEPAQ